jgi:hypothetical protein
LIYEDKKWKYLLYFAAKNYTFVENKIVIFNHNLTFYLENNAYNNINQFQYFILFAKKSVN